MTDSVRAVLRDGTRVTVRALVPEDRERLQRGMALLSPRSRYLRFHAGIEHLSEAQLDHLTAVDGRDHVAWLALDDARPDDPGVGVARYLRLPDEPTVAEAAVTVVDDYQGRGVGSLLLGLLARSARDNGVTTFRTFVLLENEAMLDLLGQLGALSMEVSGAEAQVDVPLPRRGAVAPDTPAAGVLRAAAAGRVRLALSRLLPLRLDAEG